MKLSIFTTIKNPKARGDTVDEALKCYSELADEVIVVNGGIDYDETDWLPEKTYLIDKEWPKEFDWSFIGQQFQRGYEACTGDIVIHADLDFIFHENHYESIRKVAERLLEEHEPACSFYKYQFVLPDRYNLKSRLVVMVNKKDFGDRIKFNSGGDLAQPSLDGVYISPDSVPEAGLPFYNYEKILKTKAQVMDDVGRMERSYGRHFGKTQYGSDGPNIDAYSAWVEAQIGKFKKPMERIKITDHPKVMQQTILNLTPEQFGYNGHGKLGDNNYVKSRSN